MQKEKDTVALDKLSKSFPTLIFHQDTSRKGHRLIAELGHNWELRAYMAPPGAAILASPTYQHSPTLIFMQCTNARKASVGMICVGRLLTANSKLKYHKQGEVKDSFFCIQQCVFLKDDELYVAYHKIDTTHLIGTTPSEMIRQFQSHGLDSFVWQVFSTERFETKVEDVEFVYLNQIAGPSLPGWNVKDETFYDGCKLSSAKTGIATQISSLNLSTMARNLLITMER